jgi:hypothetical protein
MEADHALPSGADDSPTTMGGNVLDTISTARRGNLIRLGYKTSLALSYTLALFVVVFDFWAQVNSKPYVIHDWLLGLIISPLVGWFFEALKDAKQKRPR